MHPSTQVSPPQSSGLLTRIRFCLAILMAGLFLSGLAHFPLVRESHWLLGRLAQTAHFGAGTPFFEWILRVHLALAATALTAPFLAYGTDWLALTYLLLAILFAGPYRDPVRNQWVINFGLIVCIAVGALAFIAGPIRQIPVFWRWIDAGFAFACAVPLILCRHYMHILANITANDHRQRIRKTRRLRRDRKSRDRHTLS